MSEQKAKNPKAYKILFKLSIVFLVLAIVGFVLTFTVPALSIDGHVPGPFLTVPVLLTLASLVCLTWNLIPTLIKTMMKLNMGTFKYIQETNKDNLKDIVDINAEIGRDAVKTYASAIKEGFEQDLIYCKHCGGQIESDSSFCKHCGKNLK